MSARATVETLTDNPACSSRWARSSSRVAALRCRTCARNNFSWRWPQPGRVAAAVRARGDVLTGAVQVEQLVDEGGADAEQFDHLAAGAVAAQGGDQNFLPPV